MIWRFPKIGGYLFGVAHNEDYSILGSLLGSPYVGKLPFGGFQNCGPLSGSYFNAGAGPKKSEACQNPKSQIIPAPYTLYPNEARGSPKVS